MYVVIICYRCGRLLLAEVKHKTRQCSHCGARLSMARSKHLASANSAREASRLIRAIKKKTKSSRQKLV